MVRQCSRARAARLAAVVVSLSIASGDAAAEAESSTEIVDRVVAVVSGISERGSDVRIITAFELEVEARLLLAERAHSVSGATTEPVPETLLQTTLDTIIGHLLIEGEAARLRLVTISTQDIAAERQLSEERLGGEGALERFQRATGAPEDLVTAIFRRRALVAAFVEQNIQLTTRITDEQVEETFHSGDHPFGDRPLEEIRGAIEAFLTASSQRERLGEWLEDARGRSRIRLIPP
jgi:hypothetical protein